MNSDEYRGVLNQISDVIGQALGRPVLNAESEAPPAIGCTIKELPPELQAEAAARAVEENPANRQPLDVLAALHDAGLSVARLAFRTTKYWRAGGADLTVGFTEETPADLRNRILGYMNGWGEFSAVRFRWTQTDPQVRITRDGQGHWSYLGTDILTVPKNQPTMCLQGFTMQTREAECVRVIRHEAGHTLGAEHEQFRASIVARLDPAKTIDYFRRTQGWSEAEVRRQVLTPARESDLFASPEADELSIMMYALPASITKDGRAIPGGADFSAADKLTAGKLYPKVVAPPVSPPVVPDGFGLAFKVVGKRLIVTAPSGYTVEAG